MADSVTVVAQGRTAMQVHTRSGVTSLDLAVTRPTVTVEVVGGAPGPRGPSGAQSRYEHIQVSPLADWVINHNLGYFPSAVTVLSPGGVEVNAAVSHNSVNQLTVSFGVPYAGIARIL